MKLKTGYYGGGFLAERPDAPHHPWVLGVQGSPREMGVQAGFLLAPALRKLAGGFLTPVYAQFGGWAPDGKTVPTPRQMAAGREVLWHTYKTYFEQPIRDTAPDLYEEIVGLSEGLAAAGSPVALEDLLLGNCVPEIAEPCFYTGVEGPYGESHSLCSDMAAWGAATAGGRLIHGANYDYSTFNVLHRWTGVVVARPDRGHAFIAQCIPGRVGYYRGMNETGTIPRHRSAGFNPRNAPRPSAATQTECARPRAQQRLDGPACAISAPPSNHLMLQRPRTGALRRGQRNLRGARGLGRIAGAKVELSL